MIPLPKTEEEEEDFSFPNLELYTERETEIENIF